MLIREQAQPAQFSDPAEGDSRIPHALKPILGARVVNMPIWK